MNFEEKEGLKQFYLKLMGFFVSFGLISGDKWEPKVKVAVAREGGRPYSSLAGGEYGRMHFEQMLVQP